MAVLWLPASPAEVALAADRFDAFLTADKNLPWQQNLASIPISIVILDSASNELASLLPLVASLTEASAIAPRSCVRVPEDGFVVISPPLPDVPPHEG